MYLLRSLILERLQGDHSVEIDFPEAMSWKAAPRWLNCSVGSPMVRSRGRISDGCTEGSGHPWLERGVGSPVVGLYV